MSSCLSVREMQLVPFLASIPPTGPGVTDRSFSPCASMKVLPLCVSRWPSPLRESTASSDVNSARSVCGIGMRGCVCDESDSGSHQVQASPISTPERTKPAYILYRFHPSLLLSLDFVLSVIAISSGPPFPTDKFPGPCATDRPFSPCASHECPSPLCFSMAVTFTGK